MVPLLNADSEGLAETLSSLHDQKSPAWEFLCMAERGPRRDGLEVAERAAEADRRIRLLYGPPGATRGGLCQQGLAAAAGEYVCVLRPGDVVTSGAVQELERTAADAPDVIYSDEVVRPAPWGADLRLEAKPAFSYDLVLSDPSLFTRFFVRKQRLLKAGGFNPGLHEAHAYDLFLRILEGGGRAAHLPDVLFERTEAPNPRSFENEVRQSIAGHLRRLGYAGRVTAGSAPGVFRVLHSERTHGKVAIIIPTRERADLLRKCVESIERTCAMDLFDLWIVDHDSKDPAAREYLGDLGRRHRILPFKGNFNFSRINNFAVQSLTRGYDGYVFMNNDVEAPDRGWLESMMDKACRGDVGVVGATLLYPDRTVQHAGVAVGLWGVADNLFEFHPFLDTSGRRIPGRSRSLVVTRDYSAVTAACMLVRAGAFQAVGGFDEGYAVGFNDVDLCLRIRAAGWSVVKDAEAVLIHHASMTRGRRWVGDPHPDDTDRFRRQYHGLIASGDPFFSPHFTTQSNSTVLRFEIRFPGRLGVRILPIILPPADRVGRQGDPPSPGAASGSPPDQDRPTHGV